MTELYDIIVFGGGTSGCAAAYTAGKLGLKTLLIEKKSYLGGSISASLVVPAMKSSENQINTDFFNDLTQEMINLKGQTTYQGNPGWFNPELIKIALDNLMVKTNVEVLFNTQAYSINVDNRGIKGVHLKLNILSENIDKIYTDNNYLLSEYIGAKYFVDCTGNCEIGKILNCNFLENESEAQPFSLRFIMSGIDLKVFSKWLLDTDTDRSVTSVEVIDGNIHLSTAYTWDTVRNWALSPFFADAINNNILKETDTNYFQIFTVPGMPGSIAFNCPRIVTNPGNTDILSVSSALKEGRQAIYRLSEFCKIYFPGFENSYISNIADELGIRVSARIKGKYIYTMDDIINGRKFETPVAVANYPIDIHSKDKNASTLKQVQDYQIPIEALMSDDYENLFVAGRCISADFMAQGAIRVQPTCFSMGEGAAKYIYNKINS